MSAIRQALRRAGTSRGEIDRFCSEALEAQDPRHFEELCSQWVRMERPASKTD